MIRGAIDLVHQHRIGGWMHSALGPVADRIVLAFVDGACVGSGRIELVREDLRKAGLGDGKLGFSFPISLADEADVGRILVKLEGSDLALLPPGARLARRDATRPGLADPQRLEWLRRKGLLAPAELTFIRALRQMGAVDQSLILPRSAANPKVEIAEPRATAQGLLDLLALRQIEMKEIKLAARRAADIVDAIREAGEPLPFFALHAAEAGALGVLEGSHVSAASTEGMDAAIEYSVGPDRLLFLDLGARFELPEGPPAALTVFAAF